MSDVKQPWTPGPWRAGPRDVDWCVFAVEDADDAELVAAVDAHGHQTEANARIIAKAPKMAAALAAFVRIYDRFKSRGALGQTAPVDQPEIATARAILDAIGWRWGKEGGR